MRSWLMDREARHVLLIVLRAVCPIPPGAHCRRIEVPRMWASALWTVLRGCVVGGHWYTVYVVLGPARTRPVLYGPCCGPGTAQDAASNRTRGSKTGSFQDEADVCGLRQETSRGRGPVFPREERWSMQDGMDASQVYITRPMPDPIRDSVSVACVDEDELKMRFGECVCVSCDWHRWGLLGRAWVSVVRGFRATFRATCWHPFKMAYMPFGNRSATARCNGRAAYSWW